MRAYSGPRRPQYGAKRSHREPSRTNPPPERGGHQNSTPHKVLGRFSLCNVL